MDLSIPLLVGYVGVICLAQLALRRAAIALAHAVDLRADRASESAQAAQVDYPQPGFLQIGVVPSRTQYMAITSLTRGKKGALELLLAQAILDGWLAWVEPGRSLRVVAGATPHGYLDESLHRHIEAPHEKPVALETLVETAERVLVENAIWLRARKRQASTAKHEGWKAPRGPGGPCRRGIRERPRDPFGPGLRERDDGPGLLAGNRGLRGRIDRVRVDLRYLPARSYLLAMAFAHCQQGKACPGPW